jgi:hypothetical protein
MIVRRVRYCWMPPAKNAGGEVRGALPRIPARGTPPETPARFPCAPSFQNGPRRQGFAPPRSTRAPLTAPGRSEEFPMKRESGQMQTVSAALSGLPLVGTGLLNLFGVDKPS